MQRQAIFWTLTFSFLVLNASGTADVNVYSAVITGYYSFKQISVLTQFTCFTKGACSFESQYSSSCLNLYFPDEETKISLQLVKQNFQSRFVTDFSNVSRFLDTDKSIVIQGFVVDLTCTNYSEIFKQKPHDVIFKNNNHWLWIEDQAEGRAATHTGMEISVSSFVEC